MDYSNSNDMIASGEQKMKAAQEDIMEDSAIENVAEQLAQFNMLGPLYVKTDSFERPMNAGIYRMNANVGRFVTPSNPGTFVMRANPGQFVAPSNTGTHSNPRQIGTNFNFDYFHMHSSIWQIGTPNAEGNTHIHSNSNPVQYHANVAVYGIPRGIHPNPNYVGTQPNVGHFGMVYGNSPVHQVTPRTLNNNNWSGPLVPIGLPSPRHRQRASVARAWSPYESPSMSTTTGSQCNLRPLNIRPAFNEYQFCAFCKNNRETRQVYESHRLRDEENKISCPYLRNYTCKSCGATGDSAHTDTYCPFRQYDPRNSTTRYETRRNTIGKLRTTK